MSALFVRDLLATDPLPPPASVLYERILAGNGLFLRGHRTHLQVLFPIQHRRVPGLVTLDPQIRLLPPLIPRFLIEAIFIEAFTAWKDAKGPLESLFHLTSTDRWTLTVPDQIRTVTSVRPRDPEQCPSYADCLVELHSHHEMSARFSAMDDADETGFRIYGVCGNFRRQPHITFRVGLYGHFYSIPAHLVAELPSGVIDTFTLKES